MADRNSQTVDDGKVEQAFSDEVSQVRQIADIWGPSEEHDLGLVAAVRLFEFSLNPYTVARVFAHRNRVPWEAVCGLSSMLDTCISMACAVFPEEYEKRVRVALDRARAAYATCESPIEELFLAHVAACCEEFFEFSDHGGVWNRNGVLIYPQKTIEDYRVDFAFEQDTNLCVVVEIDGHDFHERTKQQAARDKSRDRDLQELGWRVLRYTGSEIWQDPQGCVGQVLRMFQATE